MIKLRTYDTLPFDQLRKLRETGVCPVCSAHGISSRGIAGHVRGARHQAYLEMRSMQDRGLVPLSFHHYADNIVRADLPCERAVVKWMTDYKTRTSKRTERGLVGVWVHPVIEMLVKALSGHGRFGYSLDTALQRLGAMDEKKRDKLFRAAQVSIGLGCDPIKALGLEPTNSTTVHL